MIKIELNYRDKHSPLTIIAIALFFGLMAFLADGLLLSILIIIGTVLIGLILIVSGTKQHLSYIELEREYLALVYKSGINNIKKEIIPHSEIEYVKVTALNYQIAPLSFPLMNIDIRIKVQNKNEIIIKIGKIDNYVNFNVIYKILKYKYYFPNFSFNTSGEFISLNNDLNCLNLTGKRPPLSQRPVDLMKIFIFILPLIAIIIGVLSGILSSV